jgi:hypothetical protein
MASTPPDLAVLQDVAAHSELVQPKLAEQPPKRMALLLHLEGGIGAGARWACGQGRKPRKQGKCGCRHHWGEARQRAVHQPVSFPKGSRAKSL